MKIKKLFLIFTALLAVSFNFVSCFNVMEENPFIGLPEEPVNTGASGFTGPSQVKYATLQGSISFGGAVPSQVLAVINNENSGRTAMPQASSNWYYVLYATATGKTSPTPTVYPISSTSYSITGLETSAEGVAWTVTVRVLEAASAEAAKNISATTAEASAILSDYCQITLTDDNSVYVHDFIVKPVKGSGKNGTLNLTMTVPESVTNVTVDSYTSAITINTPATPNPPTGAPKTVTITGTLASNSYSIRFNFYGTNNLLLYSNRQTINVFNNCETNTWVNNGGTGNSDPISSGSYTVTDTMITNFQSNIFYVGATIFTDNLAKKTGTRAEGYTGTPVKPFTTIADAVSVIKDRNNSTVDYTILITGSVLGTQVVGDSSTSSNYYIDGKAASIRIVGARGLLNNVPQDELNLSDNATGTILSVKTSVPVTIENLKITGGKQQYDRGGGIYIASGATVKLGNGALITGNVAQYGAGIYNLGSLFMYGSARVGDTTTTTVTAESIDSAANHAPSSGPTDVRGGGVYNTGTVYLGYDGFTTDDPPQKHQCTLEGGITRNYPCGLYNIGGTVYFDSGNISYNYGIQGGGVYLTNSAKLIMTGGSITNNMAKEYGGGVQISGGGEFDFQKGTFTSNTLDATNGQYGGAVCNYSGTFKLGKETSIASTEVKNNDIGLVYSQKITVDNTLDQESFTLALANKARGTQVLTGSKVADVYSKFGLRDVYGMGLNNEGKIDLAVIVTDIYINQSAAEANSFEPGSSYTKNDSTWNNATYAFNASADSSQTKPFKKMDTALKFITYQASAQNYTIHIVGTYTVNSTDTQNIIANNTYTDNPIRLVKTATQTNPTVTATKITIAGVVDVDNPPKIVGGTFDGYSYSCVKIQTEVPVVFTNISIEGGRISTGTSGAGGINIDSSSAPRVSDVTLSTGSTVYNNRGFSIGAIQNYGTLKIDGATIKNNTHSSGLSGKGGAIYNAGGILYIYNNNTMIGQTGSSEPAKDEANKYSNYAITAGGAIYNENNVYNGITYKGTIYIGKDADGNYSNPKISYNYARNGGGIYNSAGSEINFCQGEIVFNGTSSSDGKGGGIYNEGIVTFSNTSQKEKKIYRNSAVKGGAIYESGSSAQLNMGTVGTNQYVTEINIQWDNTGLSKYNNIYLDTKSGTDPCQINITTTLSRMSNIRIETDVSTFSGKQLITASGSADLAASSTFFKCVQPTPAPDLPWQIKTDGKLGQLEARANINAAQVGDIILNNGYVIPYSANLDLDFKRNDAIAIIFCVDTSCSNDSNKRILGFSLDNIGRVSRQWIDRDKIYWSGNTSQPFAAIRVTQSGNTFAPYSGAANNGYKDGSSNYTYANSVWDTTYYRLRALDACNSPTDSVLSGTAYTTGWYLPTVTELKKIYDNKTTLLSSVAKVRSFTSTYSFPDSNNYWTSNSGDYADNGLYFWSMDMSNGTFTQDMHDEGNVFIPIRQFN